MELGSKRLSDSCFFKTHQFRSDRVLDRSQQGAQAQSAWLYRCDRQGVRLYIPLLIYNTQENKWVNKKNREHTHTQPSVV